MCTKTLSCPLCCQSNFPNIDALRLSLIKVTSRPLKCPICDDVLLGLDKLTIHLFGHSVLQDEVQQVQEADETKKRNILDSLKSVRKNKVTSPSQSPSNNNSMKCDYCGYLFESNKLLTMHVRLLHNQPKSPAGSGGSEVTNDHKYQCQICSKYFKMKGSLKIHVRVVHLEMQNRKNEEPTAENCPRIIKAEPQSPQLSDQPQYIYYPKNYASQKQQASTTVTKPSARVTPSPPQHHQPTTNDVAKLWECDICAKSFTTKYFLKKHKRLHTGEMPYACTICGKTFTFQQSYHKHLLYHSDDKPHVCSVCQRAFKELSTLHNHERIHSGSKPFECENCGKCFRQRVSYLVHRRIHTGALPYKCTACEKSFRYKVSQRTHKCTAQPPGMVVRQTGDLLQKLLQSSLILPNDDHKLDQVKTEDFISQSLDDFVKESYDKMGLEDYPVSPPSDPTIPQIENLCLLSPTREINFDLF